MKRKLLRREFVSAMTFTAIGLGTSIPRITKGANVTTKPAILGGPKAHPGKFPGWPVFDQTEEKALINVLQSKAWCRLGNTAVANFEDQYKKLTGARHCLAVSSGTSALSTALGALDIGPGDEVIIPAYTFIATYNVVTLNFALPVIVDTDIESFQIDPDKIEASITNKTKAIVPVHIGGSPANLDKILLIAGKHKIPVIEDACQAHLGEWRGRKVGTWGLAGAFSFQASKNLNAGEGGALLMNDEEFAQKCYNFHNQGQGGRKGGDAGALARGTNLRLTEFQGSLLVAQMSRLVEQTDVRTKNAAYLTSLLSEIPGIKPARLYPGTTRSAYHLYMFRFDKDQFAGMDRNRFMEALRAEGVPCSGGYGPMDKSPYVTSLAGKSHYLNIYGEKNMRQWLERNQCPENDKLCEQAVWFSQTMLLSSKTDMDQIGEAIRKIQKYAGDVAR